MGQSGGIRPAGLAWAERSLTGRRVDPDDGGRGMRILFGGLAAIALLIGGFFLIRAQQQDDELASIAAPPPPVQETGLPLADPGTMRGPAPPEATEMTREERRFARFDRNGDRIITREELLASRTKAFKALDKDGNNLLTFEEWAVATSDRFAGADGDGNGRLTPEEFATTRPKRAVQRCKC